MRRAITALLALPLTTLLVGGCSFGGRVHLGDIWLEAGRGLALVGNHVAIALH